MVTVEICFPAGRYHANPWGRNVNEGVVEWPPAPYRLARALIDACRRRHPDWDEARLASVLAAIQTPVEFRLPPAAASHIRAYLHANTEDSSKKQKIFDAFVALERTERVLVSFDAAPSSSALRDLDELLGDLNYLGRSESWVSARVVSDTSSIGPGHTRCIPAGSGPVPPGMDVIRLACVRSEAEYSDLPSKPVAAGARSAKATPLSWVQALSMSTSDLLDGGWSDPPAQKKLDFWLHEGALRARAGRRTPTLDGRFREARFAVHGAVLPRVLDTVPFAERVRRKLMGIHRRVMGGDPALVSQTFSGKSEGGRKAEGHKHAFYLPLDQNHDGRIDHLVVRSLSPFDRSELEALDGLRSVWQAGGRPDLVLVLERFSAAPLETKATHWVSATPFVTSRNHRKGRGPYDQWLDDELRRECALHGLPRPVTVEPVERTPSSAHPYRWMEFTRGRRDARALRGHGRRLTFSEPIPGPFALGALCHFGLGLFVPEA